AGQNPGISIAHLIADGLEALARPSLQPLARSKPHPLQEMRIETAKGLLSASRKSIKTIIYDVGYDDASFYARLFRQHTELSPNQ
ncbi:helix-turn-helix domain-containing protein, partial [Pseudomonas syringae pv. tagetis]|uniref:helix-turn-helix domain-containing protein n=1 Tax=Pseudomonas syringae group genomosp. 7 TaxID=251699 RepID=UPI00376FE659